MDREWNDSQLEVQSQSTHGPQRFARRWNGSYLQQRILPFFKGSNSWHRSRLRKQIWMEDADAR